MLTQEGKQFCVTLFIWTWLIVEACLIGNHTHWQVGLGSLMLAWGVIKTSFLIWSRWMVSH